MGNAREHKIPHLLIVWMVPVTLMAGPAGFATYVVLRTLWNCAPPAPTLHRWFLMVLYVTVTALCGMMVVWILVNPGTAYLGNWEGHDALVEKTWRERVMPVPLNLVLKYKGHRAVQFTHVLPAALWAMLVPLQLHPSVRKNYRTLHRRTGYLFTILGFMIAGGVGIIGHRGLYFHADFPDIPEHMHTSAIGLDFVPFVPCFQCLAAWFVLSLLLAVWEARRKRFARHNAFILRHVAAGIWIAPQRIYLLVLFPTTPERQKEVFGDGAILGVLLTVVCAELAILSKSAIDRAELKRE